MSTKKIVGVILTVLSVLGGFYSITTYSDDTSGLFGYTYTAPLTSHEVTVIFIGVVAVVALIVGIILLASKDEN